MKLRPVGAELFHAERRRDTTKVDYVSNMMAHVQKPNFVLR